MSQVSTTSPIRADDSGVLPTGSAAPGVAAPGVRQVRRNTSAIRLTDVLALVGAVFAAASSTWLLLILIPITGQLAPVAVASSLFLVYYATLVWLDESPMLVRDKIASAVVHMLSFILLSVLILVVAYCAIRGATAMRHLNFYTEDMSQTGPLDPLTVGGIRHAIVGTVQQIAIALVITVPLGIVCAVFLNEFPGRFARFVRTIVEAMTALPSIVAGLFIYATWIITLGNEKSGFAAGLALSVMMLPIIIRASDVVLRLVPGHLKEASYAMGASHWRTVWHVVLPTSRSGLTTAVILGTARGIGETSPVLLTAGFNNSMNSNPITGPQVSLPLQAFMSVKAPSDAMIARGFGTATFLLCLVLFLFVLARMLGGRSPGQTSARQRRRIARASRRDLRRFAARAAVAAVLIANLGVGYLHPSQPASAAEDYVPISGAGSTWSQNALDQWRRNVTQYGMQVNYQGTGSSDGRNQFRNGTVDFAISEIPYGLRDGGVFDTPPDRSYAYMPIVAGGTSFMYNLKIAGKRVTNLRLSGENLAKIFTGRLKMWNDPAIGKDNPQLALPARPIVPVVRSDGSGTTAQLTTWLSKRYASLWDPYCKAAGRSTPCGVTSSFPVVSGSGFTAQSGSLGVSGYVSQSQNEGTITYVEYSYALNTDFPVVKMLNKSGYYTEPTAQNVAVGLLKAQINTDEGSSNFLTQILDGVYDNADRRAYPLSSYSYMVIPTAAAGSFNEAKGKTLGAFAYYFLCEGQQQAPVLGYSPLPVNLVRAGMDQVRRIPGVDVETVDISKCNNPTFSKTGKNTLADTAPYPPACDRIGKTQCTTGSGGAQQPTAASADGEPGSPEDAGQSPEGEGGGAPLDPGEGSGPAVVDPDTGELVSAPVAGAAGQLVSGTPQSLDATYSQGLEKALMLLAGLMLLLVVLVPPIVGQLLSKRRTP